MRSITAIAASILTAAPLVAFGPPAHAGNDFLGKAQRFFNNDDNDRNAYQRGRDDEMRRNEAQRDRDHYGYRRDYDQSWNRDRGDQRWSNNGYRNNDYDYR